MSYVRQWARDRYKKLASGSCANCGYAKHVEICHKKPIKSFPVTATVAEINDISNIVALCPNCHWEFDNNCLRV